VLRGFAVNVFTQGLSIPRRLTMNHVGSDLDYRTLITALTNAAIAAERSS